MEEIKVERICLKCGEVNEVSAENMRKVDTWTEDGEPEKDPKAVQVVDGAYKAME